MSGRRAAMAPRRCARQGASFACAVTMGFSCVKQPGVVSSAVNPSADPAVLWQHCPDLLVLLAGDDTVQAANPAWRTLLGRAPEAVVGRPFAELVHPDDRVRLRTELAWTRERGGHEFVARCRHERGHEESLAWSVARHGEVLCACGRRQAAPPPAAGAAPMPGRLHRVLATGRLAGGIAHDFNNRLQALRNALELIHRGADDAESVRRWSESALRVVDRGARLTAQLLAAAGVQRLQSRPVAVVPLLRGMRDLLQRTLPAQVQVRMELAADAGSVLSDSQGLEVAVLNLALNGSEAMPHGGPLTISCDRVLLAGDTELPTGEYLRVAVSDCGEGMTEAVRERAFEHYFTTKPAGPGSGLGLSQVYGFSRQSGGTTRIESSTPHGTTISLLLPVLAQPQTAAAAAEPGSPAEPVVLVVDTDADARGLLCDSLRVLGYRAVPASDGLSALSALDRHEAAVLVVDCALRDMSGAGVAQQARRAWPHVGIVVVGNEGSSAQAPPPGTQRLAKPFDLASLAAAVERARGGGS